MLKSSLRLNLRLERFTGIPKNIHQWAGEHPARVKHRFACRHHPVNSKRVLLRYGRAFLLFFAVPEHYTRGFLKLQGIFRLF